ncbi:hypothetical protein D3C71_2005960 [compost metagenome]
MTPFLIYTGFYRDTHAGLQPDIQQLLVKPVRFLMDIGEITDPVAGAAFVVQSVIPQGLPGQHIQMGAGGAIQEFSGG